MLSFVKSMWWIVKKHWYRYILVLFFSFIIPFINLIPATIIARLTQGIQDNAITYEFLIFTILIPYILTVLAMYLA